MTRRLDFRLLGPLEVLDGARSLPLGGRKQRTLLAILLLHANEVVGSDSLIDGIWGERVPKTAPTALQVSVSNLRKLLSAERVETRSPGYVLNVEPDELDLDRFERLCREARGLTPEAAAAALAEALALWHGQPLADFAYESFAQSDIARLEELRVGALGQRIDAELVLGRHADLIGELESLVAAHPLRERLRAQLILALYRSGRQAEALEAYRQARETLVEELGIEPGAGLKELERAILAQDEALEAPPQAEPEPGRQEAAQLPTGTVTLLFTDIEGSTKLLQTLGRERYVETLDAYRRLLREACSGHRGVEVEMQGDSFHFAFPSAREAVEAAAAAKRALAGHAWPGEPLRVRIGLHTGEPTAHGELYAGLDVHRAARIMAAGHGGQVLASQATASVLADGEVEGIELRDLGQHRLKDLDQPERIYQLEIEGLDRTFPRLRTAAWTRAATEPPAEPVVAPLGRDVEHAALVRFLAALAERPRGLLVTGEAGIGKTTVWEAALAEACRRSYLVLSSRATASERQLSFAGLGDLLDGVLAELLPGLPTPQRRALEAALGVAEARAAPEARLIGIALLNALRALAAERPLVVAIDDLQWLDEPSGQLLAFALRRLQNEPVGLLANLRAAPGAAAPFELDRGPAEWLERLVIGPLSLGALRRLLRERLASPVPRTLPRRIHEHSGGNPFYALELARALVERGEERLPESLSALVADRIEQLPNDTRSLLVALAAAAYPTIELVRALGSEDALEPAEREGVLLVEDRRLRFSHPLLAAAAHDAATSRERRAANRRLAELVDDPEQRARHLALAAEGPNKQVAAALDAAAAAALARGAPVSAAELADRALALTPPGNREALHRRRIEAAKRNQTLGNTRRQRELLEQALAAASTALERAEALWQLAVLVLEAGEDAATARAMFDEALECAAGDDALCASIYLGSKRAESGFGATVERAQAALAHAERSGNPALEATALAYLAESTFSYGLGFRRDLFERAVTLEQSAGFIDTTERPSTEYGWAAIFAGDIPLARELLERAAARLQEEEDATAGAALFYLAWLHLIAGEWEQALERADESRQISLDTALDRDAAMGLVARAAVEAHQGRLDDARAHLEETSEFAELFAPLWAFGAGMAALSCGNPTAAAEALGPAIAQMREQGITEPGLYPWFPAYAEALVQLDRVDDAEELAGWLEEHAVRLERRWALAMCAHVRGLIAAARGDPETAIAELERAIELHEGVGRPFDRAWTLLVYGQTLRRAKRRRLAREALAEAHSAFERLGAALWAERARAELARIGGRRPASEQLTATEKRIATLVATGKSNKQVAAELFVTVRTVETNLSRIYAKLGVHSRTELAAKLQRA